jgi:hypothetical protein
MADLEAKHWIVREDREHGKFLVPADLMVEGWLSGFKTGDVISTQSRKARSYQNHKHFFVLLHKARLQLEAYQDDESLLDALKIAVGHTRPVQVAVAADREAQDLVAKIEELKTRIFDHTAILVFDEMISVLSENKIIWLPKSINWDVMDEDDFRRFKNRCVYVLGQLLGFDPMELMNNNVEGSNY